MPSFTSASIACGAGESNLVCMAMHVTDMVNHRLMCTRVFEWCKGRGWGAFGVTQYICLARGTSSTHGSTAALGNNAEPMIDKYAADANRCAKKFI